MISQWLDALPNINIFFPHSKTIKISHVLSANFLSHKFRYTVTIIYSDVAVHAHSDHRWLWLFPLAKQVKLSSFFSLFQPFQFFRKYFNFLNFFYLHHGRWYHCGLFLPRINPKFVLDNNPKRFFNNNRFILIIVQMQLFTINLHSILPGLNS